MSLKDSRWSGVAVIVLLGLMWEVAGRAGWVHKLLFPPLSVILGKLFEISSKMWRRSLMKRASSRLASWLRGRGRSTVVSEIMREGRLDRT